MILKLFEVGVYLCDRVWGMLDGVLSNNNNNNKYFCGIKFYFLSFYLFVLNIIFFRYFFF